MTPKSQQLATLARYCVTKSPGFAAIALWVPYSATESRDFIAFTDGKRVVAGPAFWDDFAPLEQAFILCHEILHVALRHVPRGGAFYRASGEHGRLWNIACDAVINHALGQMSWLHRPAGAVKIEEILGRDTLENRPAATWSAEAIYHHLLDEIGAPPERGEVSRRIEKWLEDHGFEVFDMLLGEGGEEDERSAQLASRIWASRLARAQAGDRAGGLLRALSSDFPTVATPWQQILRAHLQDAILPQSRENWNRPSRRVLAGNVQTFEPATSPERGLRRAGVVIDTSGSINRPLLERFCAEVSAVQRRTGGEIALLCADWQVQSEVIVRNDGRPLIDKVRAGEIAIRGGGGTDFAPALARLGELKVSVALYFTDMQGSFGPQKPLMPLLWCATTPGQSAPFGRVVTLD